MKKTRRSKAEIIELHKALQRELGKLFGQQVFTKLTGVTASEIKYYWGNWTDFVVSTGGTPTTATPRLDDDEVFRDFAKVCIALSKVPTQNELRIATRKLSTKTHTVDTRFGSRKAFDAQFRAWLDSSAAPIRSIVMIVASALMRMVEESIRDRSQFALADFERELFGNRVISI